jgi:dihydrofolate reductase
MSKILLNLAVTLDGFIEGPDGEFDWCFTDQDYGMDAFLARCDAIVFGRKSYEVMLQFDPDPYPDKMKYVFSQTIPSVAGKSAVLRGDVAEATAQIKQRGAGDIWFFGGASLLDEFMRQDLIDEMHLSIHPLLLGAGKRLFPGLATRQSWRLLGTTTYESGLVQLVYGRG